MKEYLANEKRLVKRLVKRKITHQLLSANVYGVDYFKFEVFWLFFICHEAVDYTLEKVFVDAAGGYMVDDCFHTPHETVCMPVLAILDEEPYSDCQRHTLIGVLNIMSSTQSIY